jgi:hypothetical protein
MHACMHACICISLWSTDTQSPWHDHKAMTLQVGFDHQQRLQPCLCMYLLTQIWVSDLSMATDSLPDTILGRLCERKAATAALSITSIVLSAVCIYVCMYMCMCMCMRMFICIIMYVRIYEKWSPVQLKYQMVLITSMAVSACTYYTYVCMHACTHMSMYVDVYVWTYVHMNVRMYERMYERMHVRAYVCLFVCMYVHMHTCMCLLMYVCMCDNTTSEPLSMVMPTCTFVCVYVCMSVWIDIREKTYGIDQLFNQVRRIYECR